jgi:hypothetical protein
MTWFIAKMMLTYNQLISPSTIHGQLKLILGNVSYLYIFCVDNKISITFFKGPLHFPSGFWFVFFFGGVYRRLASKVIVHYRHLLYCGLETGRNKIIPLLLKKITKYLRLYLIILLNILFQLISCIPFSLIPDLILSISLWYCPHCSDTCVPWVDCAHLFIFSDMCIGLLTRGSSPRFDGLIDNGDSSPLDYSS